MAQWKRVSFTSANAQTPARALECGASPRTRRRSGDQNPLGLLFFIVIVQLYKCVLRSLRVGAIESTGLGAIESTGLVVLVRHLAGVDGDDPGGRGGDEREVRATGARERTRPELTGRVEHPQCSRADADLVDRRRESRGQRNGAPVAYAVFPGGEELQAVVVHGECVRVADFDLFDVGLPTRLPDRAGTARIGALIEGTDCVRSPEKGTTGGDLNEP